MAAIRRGDPFAKLRLPLDDELLDLAWRLLRWDPAERLAAADALRHPAFAPRPQPPTTWSWAAASTARVFRKLLLKPPEEGQQAAAGGADGSAAETCD